MTEDQKDFLNVLARAHKALKDAFATGEHKAAEQTMLKLDLVFEGYVPRLLGWKHRHVFGTFLKKGYIYAFVKLDGPNGTPLWALREYKSLDDIRKEQRSGKLVKMFKIPGGKIDDEGVPF